MKIHSKTLNNDTPATPEKSLQSRAFQAGGVAVIGFVVSQVIRLGSNLLMTRLLLPESFGLMAIAISLQILLINLSDIGLSQSLVRSQSSNDPKFLSTVFVTQIARGIILGVVLLIFAALTYPIAQSNILPSDSIINDPRLPIFIVVTAFMVFLEGFKSLKFSLCQRDLNLAKLTILEISAQIVGLVCMVSSFFMGAGPYALLVGMTTATLTNVIGSYLALPGPAMEFKFYKHHFNEIFAFGKWLILASLLGFLMQRGDQFIFGAIMDKSEFGLYTVATMWIMIATTLADAVLMRIAYPSFSETWRKDPQEMTKIYNMFRLSLDIGAVLIFAGLFLLGDFVFSIIYADSFSGVIYYLKLISVIILLLPYRLINITILASGHSKNFLNATIAPALMVMIGIPLVYQLVGLKAAIVFGALNYLPTLPVAWYNSRKLIKVSWARELPLAIFAVIAAILIISN